MLLIISAPMSGCIREGSESANSNDLEINPDVLISGIFQDVSLKANKDMSVFVPYLVKDPISGYVQNSTIVNIKEGSFVSLEVLSPPRTEVMVMLIGELGRINWPVRDGDESWESWFWRDELRRGARSGESLWEHHTGLC